MKIIIANSGAYTTCQLVSCESETIIFRSEVKRVCQKKWFPEPKFYEVEFTKTDDAQWQAVFANGYYLMAELRYVDGGEGGCILCADMVTPTELKEESQLDVITSYYNSLYHFQSEYEDEDIRRAILAEMIFECKEVDDTMFHTWIKDMKDVDVELYLKIFLTRNMVQLLSLVPKIADYAGVVK